MKAIITPDGELKEAETYEQLYEIIGEKSKYPYWSLIEKGYVFLKSRVRQIYGTSLVEELKTYQMDERPKILTEGQTTKLKEL